MEIFVWAYLGGLLGAILMDAVEKLAAKAGITSGVSVALVGRWFLWLVHGRLLHTNIVGAKPYPREAQAGWAFHFLLGGGGVALFYPFFFHALGGGTPLEHLLGGVCFGLASSLLPWFVLLPSFGWGIAGWRGPPGARPLLASPLSHLFYGLGVGVMGALGALNRQLS
ncbi:DUF2938 family protein [Pseudoduganella aquatica]|uniref:DUF2938 family protein n=1 Tax=Pseudoduganella aquatica TaxID=2660641 RepID=UPI001E3BCCFB|nr:DUF2938 family protein [Pseudoduganella aquatica]